MPNGVRSGRISVVNGLYALKPWYTRRLNRAVQAATRRGTSPDLFTVVGIAGGALAGLAVALGWWPIAALALAIRLAGANLDGAVARARGVSRPWGFVLNEIGDRTSDLLTFAGLVVLAARTSGGWDDTSVLLATAAALAATLPTFASLAASGAGATRRNGGPLGKTERCLLVVIAAAVPSWLVVIAILLVVGSLATTGWRLVAAHRELASTGAEPAGSSC